MNARLDVALHCADFIVPANEAVAEGLYAALLVPVIVVVVAAESVR